MWKEKQSVVIEYERERLANRSDRSAERGSRIPFRLVFDETGQGNRAWHIPGISDCATRSRCHPEASGSHRENRYEGLKKENEIGHCSLLKPGSRARVIGRATNEKAPSVWARNVVDAPLPHPTRHLGVRNDFIIDGICLRRCSGLLA